MNVYHDLKKDQIATVRKAILNDLGKQLKDLNPSNPSADEPKVLEQCARLIILLRELADKRVDNSTTNLYLPKKSEE